MSPARFDSFSRTQNAISVQSVLIGHWTTHQLPDPERSVSPECDQGVQGSRNIRFGWSSADQNALHQNRVLGSRKTKNCRNELGSLSDFEPKTKDLIRTLVTTIFVCAHEILSRRATPGKVDRLILR